jgi:hypothetical protein
MAERPQRELSDKEPVGLIPISHEGCDLSLLEHSLSKTPWERMQANDDALRFAQILREHTKMECRT